MRLAFKYRWLSLVSFVPVAKSRLGLERRTVSHSSDVRASETNHHVLKGTSNGE